MVTLQHWRESSVKQFNDGTIKEYSSNVIASNIYEEGDADGFSSLMSYQIIDHKSSERISI